jgi:hypothetical protein
MGTKKKLLREVYIEFNNGSKLTFIGLGEEDEEAWNSGIKDINISEPYSPEDEIETAIKSKRRQLMEDLGMLEETDNVDRNPIHAEDYDDYFEGV